MYHAGYERSRRDKETPARICAIAVRKGYFSVSLRYRDDWLRERCAKLRRRGMLTGGRRQGCEIVFYPSVAAQVIYG